jgi:hypothetical protein
MTTFSDYLQKVKLSHLTTISICELRKRRSFYNEMSKTHEGKTFLDKKEVALEIIEFDDDNEKDSLYSPFSYEELKGIKRSYNENSKTLLKEVPDLFL